MKNYFLNKNAFRIADYFCIAVLFLATFLANQHIYLAWDVSWHLEGAKRMLEGGSYATNMFDDNPPMVFWIYFPVVLMHQLTNISLPTLTIIENHFLILMTLLLCNPFLKIIFADSKSHEIQWMRYAILLCLLVFPICNYGHREMMLTTFCLPYIVLMGARLNTDIRSNNYLLAFVGLWMAIGVAMNPLYGCIALALEIQFWISQKKIILFRPELMMFIAACLAYLISIELLYPEFYRMIIPAVIVFSTGFDATYAALNHNIIILPSIIAAILYFALNVIGVRRPWLTSLFLCTVVSYLVYLSNKKIWYYHLYPALVFCFLWLTAIFLSTFNKQKSSAMPIRFFSFATLLVFTISMLGTYISFAEKTKGAMEYENSLTELITYFNQQPKNSTLYSLSVRLFPAFPLVDYTSLRYLPPWPNCWTIPLLVQNPDLTKVKSWKKPWMEKYKAILLNQVADDLKLKKPDYVIVDINKEYYFHGVSFSMIDFFSQNAEFRSAWRQYRLAKVVGEYQIYRFHYELWRRA